MNVAQSGTPFPFEYSTYDFASGLYVRANVWQYLVGAWSLIQTVNMTEVSLGLYAGQFTGSAGQIYLVQKLVYTDSTYITVDASRAPGSEAIQCRDLTASSGGVTATTYLSTDSDLVGTIDGDDELEGFIQSCE